MKKFIGCDVDGVLTNGFVSKLIKLFNENSSTIKLQDSDIKSDIRDYYKNHNVPWKLADDMIKSAGFVESMEPDKVAQKTLQKLKSEGVKILFITSPYVGCVSWMHERAEWLCDHFDANYNNIIFARDKTPVSSATVLIDDKIENCTDWARHNGDSILFAQPWNEKVGLKYSQHFKEGSVHSDPSIANEVIRTNDWNYIYNKAISLWHYEGK